MDLHRLRLFVRVAEEGSLTKAANAMDMMQPVLSRHIANLEREIGGRLFNRTGRGVDLSELGELLLPRIRQLIEDADSIEADATAAAGSVLGEVRIGMLASFANPLAIRMLTIAASDYPQVRIKIFEGTMGRIDEWLDEGRIDISLSFSDGRIALGDVRQIGTVDTYLLGPVGDPLLESRVVPFKALADLPLILSATQSGLREMLGRLAIRHDVNINIAYEVDSVDLHFELAAAGLGFAVMTPQAIAMKLGERRLSYARISDPAIFRHIVLGTSVKRAPTNAVQQIADLIADIGGDLVRTGVWSDLPENGDPVIAHEEDDLR